MEWVFPTGCRGSLLGGSSGEEMDVERVTYINIVVAVSRRAKIKRLELSSFLEPPRPMLEERSSHSLAAMSSL